MLAVSCRLSPEAVRLWVLAHANWCPAPLPKGAAGGRAVLPYSVLMKRGFRSQKIIARAFRELQGAGLLLLDKAGTIPAKSGGARGEAAVYRLPNREGGANAVRIDLPPGVGKPHGIVRWNVHRMRADCLKLAKSGAALKVLCALIAWRDRAEDGALAAEGPLQLSITELSAAVGLPRSTTAHAIETLIEGQMMEQDGPQLGRAKRRLELAGAYRKRERRSPHEIQSAASPPGRNMPPPLPVRDASGLCPTREAKKGGRAARSVRLGNTM